MIRLRNARVALDIAPEFGCRWMHLDVDAAPLIVPVRSLSTLKKDPFFDGAYLMAPWCNRIPKALLRFRGISYPLRPNFPDGSAIHGDVVNRRWRVVSRSSRAMTAELDSRRERSFNFPWPVVIRHGVRLTARGVSAWLSVKNAGDTPCPAGLGFHPFFPRRINDQDASLTIPSRKPAPLRRKSFDEGYRLNGRDVVLDYGTAGEIRLTPGANATDLFVWSPKTFRGKAARFACVEPMTMKVGSFGKAGTRALGPGETLRLGWTITFSRSPETRS